MAFGDNQGEIDKNNKRRLGSEPSQEFGKKLRYMWGGVRLKGHGRVRKKEVF